MSRVIPYNIADMLGAQVPSGMYVQMRAIPGVSSLDKFGVNPLIDPATDPEDIWEFGGEYPYDADGTAPIISLSSSSNADVGIPIEVQGLDVDGNLITQLVTLNGQTRVALSTPLWRVFRAQNEGDTGQDFAGTVYCYTGTANTAGVPADGNVRAIITDGNNQTLMSVYTVPKGKVGFIFRGEFGMEANPAGPQTAPVVAKVRYESRRYGKVFKVKKELDLLNEGSSNYQDIRSFPDLVPELTDIRMRVQSVSDICGVWSTLDMLLFDIGSVPSNLQSLLGY